MHYDVHMERSAGWSAIAFVVAAIVGIIAAGTPPSLWAPGPAIAAYVAAHQSGLVFACWIQFLVVIFFLWFIVGLRGYLRDASGGQNDGLPTYMLLGGLALAILVLLDVGFLLAMVYPPMGALLPRTMKTLYIVSQIFGVYAFIPSVVFAFAAAHSMRRHNSGPGYIVWIGYLAAVLLAVGTLTLFAPTGFFAVGGTFTVIATLVLLLFVVLTGIFLIRRHSPLSS